MYGGDNPQILPVTVKTMGLNLGEFPCNDNMEARSRVKSEDFLPIYLPHRLNLSAGARTSPSFQPGFDGEKLNENPILKINNHQNNNACLWLADCVTEQCSKVWKESHLGNTASQSPAVKSGKWWKIKAIMLFVIKYYQQGNVQARPASAG